MKTFAQWLATPVREGQRIGQFLMNTAPDNIYNAASGDFKLDCFQCDSYDDEKVKMFIQFAELCWDVTDPNELKMARQMVVFESL